MIQTAEDAQKLVEDRFQDVARGVIPIKLTFPDGDVQAWIVIIESSFPNLNYVRLVLETGKVMSIDDEFAQFLRKPFPPVIDGLR